MIKTNLELRDYQLVPANFALEKEIAVLALAPNSGKSEISIYVISEYLRQNKGAKVLFMPHATNVLLDNIISRMDERQVDFTYSKNLDDDVQVHIKLPHHEKDLKNNKYDFVVVDEAHEHYHAKRMQRIIKACNPKKQLLLTGTPEGFIRKGGYDIFPLAANDIAEEWFAKLNVELVASNYKWGGHYNEKQNINDKFKFYKEDSRKTLESVVLTLLERVKGNLTADEFNKIKIIPTIKSWFRVSKKIGKTLITCQRTVQADQIYKILKDQGVNVGVSHSKSDLESEEVAKFKRGEYDIMVVVNRARLGYSDEDLMNVIDMSGTHNPSLIYQMFARALRGTPDQQKYYLKVTPQGEGQMDLTHMSVCAALMLTDKRYLSTYNGRNFNGIVIPVKKVKRSGGSSGGTSTKKKKEKVVFPDFSNDVIDMFKNVISNFDKPASIYKAVTVGEVRKRIGNTSCLPAGHWTYKRCEEEASKYDSRHDFEKGCKGAYVRAKERGWLVDFFGERDNGVAKNFKQCQEEALKYKTKKEFRENKSLVYKYCDKKGWLKDVCGHMSYDGNTMENCEHFAKQCQNRKEFKQKFKDQYLSSIANGWINYFFPAKRVSWVSRTESEVIEDSKAYETLTEIKKKNKNLYYAIKRRGLKEYLRENGILKNKSIKKIWSRESFFKESENFKTRNDLYKNNRGAYNAGLRNGWLDEAFLKTQDLIEA